VRSKKLKGLTSFIIAFIITIISAYLDIYYRRLVQFFYKFFNNEKKVMFGKDFYLFPSTIFLITSFFFALLLVFILRQLTVRPVLIIVGVLMMAFFGTTILSIYCDVKYRMIENTQYYGAEDLVIYNNIKYDMHFMMAVFICAILLILFYKKTLKSTH
jgi:hypothetical protein